MDLMEQAPMTVNLYANAAIKWCVENSIDPEENPAIIAAFIQSCAKDYETASTLKGLEDLAISLERVSDAIAMAKNE